MRRRAGSPTTERTRREARGQRAPGPGATEGLGLLRGVRRGPAGSGVVRVVRTPVLRRKAGRPVPGSGRGREGPAGLPPGLRVDRAGEAGRESLRLRAAVRGAVRAWRPEARTEQRELRPRGPPPAKARRAARAGPRLAARGQSRHAALFLLEGRASLIWWGEAGDKGASVGLALFVTTESQRTMRYEIPKTDLPGQRPGNAPQGWWSPPSTCPTDAPPSCSARPARALRAQGRGEASTGPRGRAGRTREPWARGTEAWPEL